MSRKRLRYRVGIDVGLYSVGLAAIEIDDSSDDPRDAMPLEILNAMSVIHDGGVDPDKQKSADSRKAVSGVARRTRRLNKRRRERLRELDNFLIKKGFPVKQAKEIQNGVGADDPYLAWRARAELVESYIDNEEKRRLALTIALRHLARHRGWRNPYARESSLEEDSASPSAFYNEFLLNVERWRLSVGLGLHERAPVRQPEGGKLTIDDSAWSDESIERLTPSQLVVEMLEYDQQVRVRSNPDKKKKERQQTEAYANWENLPAEKRATQVGKLHQSDYWHEMKQILDSQHVEDSDQKKLFEIVFKQVNPRDVGAAAKLVARDDLQPAYIRASRASIAFQQYRVLTTLTNLRIKTEGKEVRALSLDEIQQVYAYLTSEEVIKNGGCTWHDIADQLGIERSFLKGVGGTTSDGEPISVKVPPFVSTEHAIAKAFKKKELTVLRDWWTEASLPEKEMLVEYLGNSGLPDKQVVSSEMAEAQARIISLFDELAEFNESALDSLDSITLPSGRVAYSVDTLARLNRRMLNDGLDLFQARKAEFGVEDDWRPEGNDLGTPTGNPAADRTIKIVARWLRACHRKWGVPETIQIEHVREGFTSPKTARNLERQNDRRYQENLRAKEKVAQALEEEFGSGSSGTEAVRMADVRRHQALERQNCQCAYCGKEINMQTSQMDHIVPRKGVGSSNELANLVATCADCNIRKSNTLFYRWATPEVREKTIERVDSWTKNAYFSARDFSAFKRDVKARLMQREEDEPIDNRSIESVAWMARELRAQIEKHFGYSGVVRDSTDGNDDFGLQRVSVFRGAVTSEARKASGIEKRLPWIGDASKKTRLDRRHHAVDAAVIALMRPAVAKVLMERDNLRRIQLDSVSTAEQREQLKELGPRYWKNWGNENATYCHWRDEQMQVLCAQMTQAMEDDEVVVTNPVRLRLGMGRAHEDTVYPLIMRKVGDELSAACVDKSATPAQWTALTRDPEYDPEDGLPSNPERKIRIHDKWYGPDDEIGFMATSDAELDVVKGTGYTKVRDGFAAIGNAIHHARFYRIPKINKKGKQTGWQFAYLRVFQQDLLSYANEDLFSCEIAPSSISRRLAVKDLRRALDEDTAEYLGWAVIGDEIEVDIPESGKNDPIGLFQKAFPGTCRFKLTGFMSNSQITLNPIQMSGEGTFSKSDLEKSEKEPHHAIVHMYGDKIRSAEEILKINKVISGQGYNPTVNVFLSYLPAFIRRDTLGNARWTSKNSMPASWKATPHLGLEK